MGAEVQLTFADLSVLLAKKYFSGYVAADAPLERCVAVLNEQGICFSAYRLLDRQSFVTREDFARSMGQATLVFRGEAELIGGCVKKPVGVDTWVDYCELNDIHLNDLWVELVQGVKDSPLEEVQRFFGSSPVIGGEE